MNRVRLSCLALQMVALGCLVTISTLGQPLNRYIVVLKPEGGPPEGVAAESALTRDPRVAYVETDDPVQIYAQTAPT